MRAFVVLGLVIVVTACAKATISSPGKSDDAIRADMNACNAGSLSLHDRSVINCLNNHGDTVTYADETIPPFTNSNPNRDAMTAAEVQKRQAAATAVLNRWQSAAAQNDNNQGVETPIPSPSPILSVDTPVNSITDQMYQDLQEVVAPNGTPMYPNGMPNDMAMGTRAQSVGDYFVWRNHDSGNNQGIHWASNKELQDFVKAKRWYQFALGKLPEVLRPAVIQKIKECDYNLSGQPNSARAEVADEQRQEQADADDRQRRLSARKKVGDCIALSGGTGFLGLGDTIGTVTGVSGDTITWVAHLHRNGHMAPAAFGGQYYVPSQDFDRQGSAKFDEVSLCR